MNENLEKLYNEERSFVLGQFEETRLTYQEVAEGAGISKRTVEKIARREIESPAVPLIGRLANFFRSAA